MNNICAGLITAFESDLASEMIAVEAMFIQNLPNMVSKRILKVINPFLLQFMLGKRQ